MSTQHLDRLSAVDASFLHREGPAAHMHIGALALFEGPAPAIGDVLGHVRRRLHRVPRYRQRLASPPFETGRPVWVDDPRLNLAYHVRHTALPPPGGEAELLQLVGRIFSQQLDRTKPLWEIWVVEGLADGRFALVAKTHHALVDGVTGVDLMTVLFDPEGEARETEGRGTQTPRWIPYPEPTGVELLAGSLRSIARETVRIAEGAAKVATRPALLGDGLRRLAQGVGELALANLNPAPPTPLNVPIGPHRRFAAVTLPVSDFKLVKDAFGGTVNDVVLATVGGALAAFLRSRGHKTEGVTLRASVPISVRPGGDRERLGNRLTQVFVPLPLAANDPLTRLSEVHAAMEDVKESRQALGAEAIARMEDFAPPTILAQASRLNFSNRLYNLRVTNIPGPQEPLCLLGRRLDAVHPVSFLDGNRALAVAVMSYDGRMHFGLLGDYDVLPDLDVIAGAISDALAELVRLARRRRGGTIRAEARAKRASARARSRRTARPAT